MKISKNAVTTIKCIISIWFMSIAVTLCCGIHGQADLVDIIDYLYNYSILATGMITISIICGRCDVSKTKVVSYVDKAINLLKCYKIDGCKDKDLLDRVTWCIEQEQKKKESSTGWQSESSNEKYNSMSV